MFFYAAKLVWFLLQPPVALLLLLIGGLLLVAGGGHRLGGAMAAVALAGLFASAFAPLGPALLLPLERRFERVDPKAAVTGIIVLGGGTEREPETGSVAMAPAASDRMAEALALARRFPAARIVFSGGSGDLVPASGATEGAAARRLLRSLGIDDERVTIEDASRNTAENARFAAAIVDPKPGETWLLVTSAFHMPRAMGSFRAAGWDPVPWPTDYRTRGYRDLVRPVGGPSRGFTLVNLAAKEWAGLIAYRLTGRSDALFPAP
ncbi:YdcF family protein [Kaistia adipata]|uniref:YdcF family protein n=1 Tax=Kaistia adipata TaxID=166954 RepID=UPI00040CF6DF|nr:YdcF family protein [Kaistia adipata]